jgi:hypothetical protein
VFVKAGVTDLTSGWLRDEHRVYEQLQASFLPRMLGWDDDGEMPILVLDDLSGAHWPPPWDARMVDAVVATLHEVHATKPPDGLASLESHREQLASWVHVAADPQTFLELGMCSRAWLFRSASTLIEAERQALLDGSGLVHFDVRSDNLCLAGLRALLVDWNAACIGNVDLDVVAWIPSLILEWDLRPKPSRPRSRSSRPWWRATSPTGPVCR